MEKPTFNSDSKEKTCLVSENLLPPSQQVDSSFNSKKRYTVTEYDEMCEDHSRIESVLPLSYSWWKISLLIFLNLITAFIIDLVIVWFPSLKLIFIYSHVPLSKAKFLAVYGTDKSLNIINLEKKNLPNIDNSFLFQEYISNIPHSDTIIFFTFKLFKYIYNSSLDTFSAINSEISTTYNKIHRSCTQGLSIEEVNFQKTIFGLCDLHIEVSSFIKLLIMEFTDPFYIFQIFSVFLWMFNNYQVYASLIIVTTAISLLVSTYETRKNMLSIQEMARYSCAVNVYRKDENGNRNIMNVQSTELVPGDLFEVQDENLAMPCDCILINGTVIVNESMLTGESTPIIKSQIQRVDDNFDPKIEKKKFLFAGTTVIQKRSPHNEKVLALVYSTGFSTAKGNLIRSILYPKKVDFKFKNDSVKYIFLMAVVSFCGFGISVPFLVEAGLSVVEIIKKSLDLITTTVPPSLPACLGIGISYAIGRLKRYGIICINRDRVNVSGKVNMICFDKTGTLTEDHLDIYGYRPVKLHNNTFVFDNFSEEALLYSLNAYTHYKAKRNLIEKNKNKDLNELFVECLATCHGATLVGGRLLGDPIDVKMFEATEWTLYETNTESKTGQDSLISTYVRPKQESDLNSKLANLGENDDEEQIFREHYELGIVRRFDFSSKLQRMSVIVKDVNDQHYKFFCKGSPEKIKELCQPDTIPSDFNEQLIKYTSKGFRVLAMAVKMMKMNYLQSQQITRERTESNMIFLGLLIVQNRLKEATKRSIEILDEAGIRMVMATGDNILTAISVSKECKLINNEAIVYSCEIENNELIWHSIENFQDEEEGEMILQNESIEIMGGDQDNLKNMSNPMSFTENFPPERYSFRPSRKPSSDLNSGDSKEKKLEDNSEKKKKRDFFISKKDDDSILLNIEVHNYPFEEINTDEYIIALTGQTFESLSKLKNKYIETKLDKYKVYYDVFKTILRHGCIFARMAPEHKTLLVESLQQEKLTVLMCGDGANDCGALRAADIGVSLSQEEASIAAHFTSTIPDISCLIKLLREGKASLVTSIQTFKYMMIYSIIQFMSVTLLMIKHSYLADYQFLATDVFIIFPLAFFIAKTGAYRRLTHHQPTDSLISFPIISSILIQTVIGFIFQYGGWLFLSFMKWYVNTCKNDNDTVTTCMDNTVIYLISNMQYLITAFAFSISKPFRKPIYTNLLLTLFMVFAFAYSVYIIVIPDPWSRKILQIYDFGDYDLYFKFYILAFTLVNFVFSYLTEAFLIPGLTKCYTTKKIAKLREKAKDPGFEFTLNQLQKIKNDKK